MKLYSIVKQLNSQYSALQFYHWVLFYVDKDDEPCVLYDDTFLDFELINVVLKSFKNNNWNDDRLYEEGLNVNGVKYLGVFNNQIDYDRAISKACSVKGNNK